jgi:hypothetical protein
MEARHGCVGRAGPQCGRHPVEEEGERKELRCSSQEGGEHNERFGNDGHDVRARKARAGTKRLFWRGGTAAMSSRAPSSFCKPEHPTPFPRTHSRRSKRTTPTSRLLLFPTNKHSTPTSLLLFSIMLEVFRRSSISPWREPTGDGQGFL